MARMRDAKVMDSIALTVSVQSSPGAHEQRAERTFAQAATLLKGVLQDLYCTTGEYFIRPYRKIKANAKWSRVSVRGESTHNKDKSFYVRIRPDDGESSWEYVLTVPHGVSAAVLQEQLDSFDRRCRAVGALTSPAETPSEPFMQAAEVEASTPTCNATAVPKPPATNASPALKSIDDLFQRMRQAVLRKEDRDNRSKAISKAIDAERKKIVEAESRIRGLENDLLTLMQEDEGDREYKEAEALVGTIKALTSAGQSQA